MKTKKFILKTGLILAIFGAVVAEELVDYKYLNKPIPIIKGNDVDDVVVDLLNPETILPPKYKNAYKELPPPEKEKFLENLVFVYIFFDVDKNKRIMEYIKRYEKDIMSSADNKVIIVMVETSGKYSIKELREKVLDIENAKQGVYVINGGKIYKYMFKAKGNQPLVLITKYNPEVKSPIEKPLSKFVVKKVIAKDFTFDDFIASINEFK
jgi:hypothetical protein